MKDYIFHTEYAWNYHNESYSVISFCRWLVVRYCGIGLTQLLPLSLSIVWLYHSGANCLLLSARHRSSSTHQNLGTLDRNSRPRSKNVSSQSQRKYDEQGLPLHFRVWEKETWVFLTRKLLTTHDQWYIIYVIEAC